jgi:hypothetical protein
MITRLLKILLAASSLAYTVYLFTKAQTGAAIGMIFVTIILTLATLRSMRLVMAFVQLRQQNMDKARVWLSRVSESSLWPRQRGYYYFLMGSMTMEQNMNDAEKFIKRALQLGLKQDHDKAAANLNLAIVASTRRKLPEAKRLIKESKRLDTKGALARDIKMVEDALNGSGARVGGGRPSSTARSQRRKNNKK